MKALCIFDTANRNSLDDVRLGCPYDVAVETANKHETAVLQRYREQPRGLIHCSIVPTHYGLSTELLSMAYSGIN